jgi:hypothetical protein
MTAALTPINTPQGLRVVKGCLLGRITAAFGAPVLTTGCGFAADREGWGNTFRGAPKQSTSDRGGPEVQEFVSHVGIVNFFAQKTESCRVIRNAEG